MERKQTRILLVDDEVHFTRVLKAYLEGTGRFEVRAEASAEAGLAAAKAWEPDLMILDVIMPDQDGGALAAQLKAETRLQHVPILFLTAAASRDEVQAHEGNIGGQRLLAKPVSAKDVLRQIDESLAEGGQAPAAAQPIRSSPHGARPQEPRQGRQV